MNNKRKYGQEVNFYSTGGKRKYLKVKKGEKSNEALQKQITMLKSAMMKNAPPIKKK